MIKMYTNVFFFTLYVSTIIRLKIVEKFLYKNFLLKFFTTIFIFVISKLITLYYNMTSNIISR